MGGWPGGWGVDDADAELGVSGWERFPGVRTLRCKKAYIGGMNNPSLPGLYLGVACSRALPGFQLLGLSRARPPSHTDQLQRGRLTAPP